MLFNRITHIWNNYAFEAILLLSLVFIVMYALTRLGKKGSYYKYIIEEKENGRVPNTPRVKKDSKGELECRRVLELLFNKPFNKDRPAFLNNPVTGGNYNLELDCYNPEMRLAIEYSGEQHYKYIPFFHKNNKEAFYNQKYRDEMKRSKCREVGIKLITVPYTVKLEDIKKYLINELKKLGYLR